MTRPTQKSTERFFVEQLLGCLELTPACGLRPGDPAPDFVMELEGCTVGIEVTQLFHPQGQNDIPLQAHESAEDRFFEMSGKRWAESGLPHVHVLVHLASVRALHPRKVDRLAGQLVQEHLAEADDITRVDWSFEKREQIPEEFVSISIIRRDSFKTSHWSGGSGAYVARLTREVLEQVEERKGLADYRVSGGGKSWLLIVMDSFRLSGTFDLGKSLEDVDCLDLDFDRIFLLDSFDTTVREIEPCSDRLDVE